MKRLARNHFSSGEPLLYQDTTFSRPDSATGSEPGFSPASSSSRRPAEQQKGADRGIDGRLYFHDDNSGQSKQILFSVKGRGITKREKAEIGVFLCFEELTKPMLREAVEAGFYPLPDKSPYPRMHILTIQQILDVKQPAYPLPRTPTPPSAHAASGANSASTSATAVKIPSRTSSKASWFASRTAP